ncbi:Lipase 3 [Melipona quadrifasciata]|uniref:Lipase 3 n=1 Tax=Melipona quadrifasciata TaxID=166423 RepID=A0A0M8ZZW8_9HYME|nr:Lipase 3 [Melipona quadrifasciata]
MAIQPPDYNLGNVSVSVQLYYGTNDIVADAQTEIAQKAGYPAESYEVVTEDGYILRLERITGSKKCPASENKTAVLLLHGILDASPKWLVAVPERALGQHEANEISDGGALTGTEIAQKAGYPAESYEVVTQDGYILRLDRITGSKKCPPSENKTAVLLLHGILDASPTWLVAGPEKALGFILADQGYDVWLGNMRGNRYSRKHLTLTISCWNEMGIYDVPAMIDHIIEQTKQEKIFMVSHSQGTTSFFVMASERPEYQEKLIASFALAPAAFLSRIENPLLQLLATVIGEIYSLSKALGIYDLEPSDRLMQRIGRQLCRDGSPEQLVCTSFLEILFGSDEKLNTTLFPLITQYHPAGAGIKQFAHYGQLIQSGNFRKFDYGLSGNIEIYNDINPPDYNLGNILLPVYLHYATNDTIADVQDVLELYEVLPNAQKFLVQYDLFAHLDFVWGEDANTLVYNEVLSLMGAMEINY